MRPIRAPPEETGPKTQNTGSLACLTACSHSRAPIVRHHRLCIGAISLLVGVSTANRARAEREVSVSRLSGDVRIDGVDADPEWQNAAPLGDFTQREPLEGKPSSPTEVRVGYDDDALYVLVKSFDDRPSGIIRRRTRRDETVTSDWVHVYLAADNHDERFAYRFSVNAAGVKQDARLVDGNTEDLAFNAVWDAQVSLDGRGWIAEFRIPFHQLAYTGEPRFRFQIIRYQARTGEQSTLFPYPRAATLPVRYMLPLRGLQGLPSPTHVELLPYASTALNRLPWHAGPTYRIGTDVKLAFSPDVQLQATLHPDFGQVESDPSELNLTVYETFLTERRPFFLDGVELLDFGLRQGVTNDKLFTLAGSVNHHAPSQEWTARTSCRYPPSLHSLAPPSYWCGAIPGIPSPSSTR
ncbi:MAG: DUF5916 domain-containing protein [Polyangiaceae bacterium]